MSSRVLPRARASAPVPPTPSTRDLRLLRTHARRVAVARRASRVMSACAASLSPHQVPTTTTHDVVVVGNGPIGSAVARHVAAAGASVCVIDGRDSLTSAWNDEGRIVRPLDAEGRSCWQSWNLESLEGFPALQAESGVEFFTKCGSLACGTEAWVANPAKRLTEAGVDFTWHENGTAVEKRFPYLSVPQTHVAVSDAAGGFVNPKRMIQAQNIVMMMTAAGNEMTRVGDDETRRDNSDEGNDDTRRGNSNGPFEKENAFANKNLVVLESAVAVRAANGESPFVETAEGGARVAKLVVLAGGAYIKALAKVSGLTATTKSGSNNQQVSLDASVGVASIRLSRRTVLLAEVTSNEATSTLKHMPTVKYQWAPSENSGCDDQSNSSATTPAQTSTSTHGANEQMSVYVLPPIRYPGPDPPQGWYVKIGGGANDFFDDDTDENNTVEALREWMAGSGDDAVADRLHEVLVSLMPRTNFLTLVTKPCVTTCTADGELQIEKLGPDGAVVAVSGCQGKAAGPADAIGRAVARQVVETLKVQAGRGG